MSNRIKKFILPEKEGNYELALAKYVKFLNNDNNVLYFEYNDKNYGPDKELGKYYISVIKYYDDCVIPDLYQYICSFKDSANITYFVYMYDKNSSIFGSFNKMFAFGL